MKDLKKDSTRVCGPSGEIISATKIGTICFESEAGPVEFKNALVVPDLDRNLLSVKKITAASSDIFVIFNQSNFEIFKGQISKEGVTRIQGGVDQSGLYALSTHLDDTASRVSVVDGSTVVCQVEVDVQQPQIFSKTENHQVSPQTPAETLQDSLPVPSSLPSPLPMSSSRGDCLSADPSPTSVTKKDEEPTVLEPSNLDPILGSKGPKIFEKFLRPAIFPTDLAESYGGSKADITDAIVMLDPILGMENEDILGIFLVQIFPAPRWWQHPCQIFWDFVMLLRRYRAVPWMLGIPLYLTLEERRFSNLLN